MSWVRLDDGIYDHPKLLTVEPADRLLYVWGLCWSSRHGTDGVIPAAAVPYLALFAGADTGAPERLVAAGLWHPLDAGGWSVHDFSDYQPSAAEVAEQRRKRAEAGRVGGFRKAENRNASDADGWQTASKPLASAKQTASKPLASASPLASDLLAQVSSKPLPRPVPSRPVPNDDFVVVTHAHASAAPADPDRPNDDDDRVREAIEELGRRDHAQALADGVAVRNKAAHLAACVAKRQAHKADAVMLSAAHPDWPPGRLADELDDPGSTDRRNGKARALRALEA